MAIPTMVAVNAAPTRRSRRELDSRNEDQNFIDKLLEFQLIPRSPRERGIEGYGNEA